MSGTRDMQAWPAECPEALTRCLRAYARRRLAHRCVRALLHAAVVALLALLTGLVLDRLADVGPCVRLAPLVAFVAAVLWGAVRVVVALLSRRVGAEALAGEVDRRSNRPGDVLRSAVNFLLRLGARERPGHAFLVDRSIREAAEAAQAQSITHLQPAGDLWRRGALAATLVVALAVLAGHPGMQMELLLRRFFNPFGNYPRPSWTRIRTDARELTRLEAGDDLAVRAVLEGRVPQSPDCVLVVSAPGGAEEAGGVAPTRMAMQPMPDGSFRGAVRNVREDFSFFLEAGDGRTARYDVQVLHPPAVVSMEAQYEPPRYARLPGRKEPVLYHEIRALGGTAVTVVFTTDLPVKQALVTLELSRAAGVSAAVDEGRPQVGQGEDQGEGPHGERLAKLIEKFSGGSEEKPRAAVKTLPVSLNPDRRGGKFYFRLEQSGMLRLRLTADSGVTNRFAPGYKVTAIPDNPPVVSITNLPEQVAVRADDVLRVCYHGRDDLGIADLQYRAASAAGRFEPATSEFIPLEKFGAKEVEGEVSIPVRELAPESIYVPTGGQEDAELDFSLSAVDLKGQIAYSRRVHVTVLRDTYDRQMRELLQQMDDLAKATDRNLAQLTSAINSLTVLRDSMGAAGSWSPDHQKKLDEVASRLKSALFTDWYTSMRYGEYRFTLYPYRVQTTADLLFNLSVFQVVDYSSLAELGKTEEGRRRLGDATAALARQREFLSDFKGTLGATTQTFQFDVLLYLVELSRAELTRFGEGGAEFTDLLKERQAARAARIGELMNALGLSERTDTLKDASQRLRKAVAEYRLEDIKVALEDIRREVLSRDEPPASANLVLEGFRRKYDDAWLAEQGEREVRAGLTQEPFARVRETWSEALLVGGDAQVTDDPLLAGRAVAFIRLASGVKDAPALLEPITAMRRASQHYLIAVNLNQACQEGSALIEGLDAGALQPQDAEVEAAWARLRDALLVLMDRASAGGFDTVGPGLTSGVAALLPYRPLVIRWDAAGIWQAPQDQARLRALVALACELRAKAVVELAGAMPDVSPLLTEVCTRLAGLLDKEREDALVRIAALKEEAKLQLPPPKDEQEAKARGSIANYRFGEAKEIVLTQYAAAHRKLFDLWQVRAVLAGDVPREAAAQHSAMVSYLWWLISDVTLSFGRYHGPSVVRRHDETAQAYLERTKDYPDNLSCAAAAMRHLAQTPGQPAEVINAMIRTAASGLDLKHEGEDVGDSIATLRTLRGEAGADSPQAALTRLGRDRTAGAFLAARAVIPLRRIASALRAGPLSREQTQALLGDVAVVRSVTSVMEDVPERDVLASLLDMLEASARAKDGALSDESRQEALALCDRCTEALAPKLSLPEFQPKVSKRLDREATLNDRIFLCRQRTHRLWQLEVVRQRHGYERERVAALLEGKGKGERWREPALQFAHLQVAQRKSTGVQREAGGTLDVHIPGVRYDLLAMPKHLYDELVRGQNEPYPEQFKDQAIVYLRGLIEDAKR